tara:strand:- start:740 stop:1063 length:324 start_codon:yes stop_codon:yes gene_type:complete
MLGSGLSNLGDVEKVLVQLEVCQDRVDDALVQSDFEVLIDLNDVRNSILNLAMLNKIKPSCDTDLKRLADLKSRSEYSIASLKERMKSLGVNTGRHKRALIGYRNGI